MENYANYWKSLEILSLLEIMEIRGFMEIYEYNAIYLK
jgi:hypothetical protein